VLHAEKKVDDTMIILMKPTSGFNFIGKIQEISLLNIELTLFIHPEKKERKKSRTFFMKCEQSVLHF